MKTIKQTLIVCGLLLTPILAGAAIGLLLDTPPPTGCYPCCPDQTPMPCVGR